MEQIEGAGEEDPDLNSLAAKVTITLSLLNNAIYCVFDCFLARASGVDCI